MRRSHALLTFMILYGAASLLHFVHNAVYLDSYPNMPVWLTPLGVMAAWLVVLVTGTLGYWAFRKGWRAVGLALIALYAALGFGGLDHYVVAPVSAHSLMMSATIIIEAVAAAMLLAFVFWTALRGRLDPAH